MNEKLSLTAPPKKSISYTLTNTMIQPNPGRKQPPPPIGPEIGPDPRNSIGARVSMSETPICTSESGIRYDFQFGYRVKFPAGNKKYLLRIYDLDSGVMLEEHTHNGGDFIIGSNKYYVRYRLEAYVEGKLVFEHDYNCEGREVCIIIPDGGLGDNLAWLPYIEEFRIMRKAKVTAVIGEWMIRLSKPQYPGLKFIPLGTKPALAFAYAIYFCGIFEADRKPWRPVDHQFLGMQRSVARILGLPLEDLHCRIPLGSARPVQEPYVCISTMATNPTKYWNYRSSPDLKDPDGWNILIRWLKSFGYRVFVLDRDKELYFTKFHNYHVPTEAEDLTGRIPISERIHYLEHADFFVGLPSGLSWLAWNCNIPVVMISGFTMPNCEFPTPYRVTNFLFCHGCWNDTNNFFDSKAPVWCPRHVGTPREIECTKTITPKMVQETILRIPVFQKRLNELREQAFHAQDKQHPVRMGALREIPPRAVPPALSGDPAGNAEKKKPQK